MRARRVLATKRGKVAVTVAVALIVVVATASAAYVAPAADDAEDPRVDIRSLTPFNVTDDGEIYLDMGTTGVFTEFYMLPRPEEIGEVVIVLTNLAILEVSWMDEPDKTYLVATFENQPDTVRVTLRDNNNEFNLVDEGDNPVDGTGSLSLQWSGGDTYLGSALVREDEHNWKGVDGHEYVELRGGTVIWNDGTDARIEVVEAGDYVHPRIPVTLPDDGNTVVASYTLAGYSLSIPPQSDQV